MSITFRNTDQFSQSCQR